MRADNPRHLVVAAQQRAEQTRTRALRAIRRLDGTGTAVTFEAVAREAGVSRSWLHSQADLRAEIQALRTRTQSPSSPPPTPQRQAATEASLLRRLEAATERLRQLEEYNGQLREALPKPSAPPEQHESQAKTHAATRPDDKQRNSSAHAVNGHAVAASTTVPTTQTCRSASPPGRGLKITDGRCARAESFRSAWTCSMIACPRWDLAAATMSSTARTGCPAAQRAFLSAFKSGIRRTTSRPGTWSAFFLGGKRGARES